LDREGRAVDAPFRLSDALYDTEGLHRDADGSYLVVEDDPSRLMRITPDGPVLMELYGDSFDPPMTEPQGVTRDPYSGNILVVDDNEGLNSLFELAPDGRVLSVSPLSQYGVDAEGVALQPETGTLYVGFDSGRALAIFDWIPTEITIDTPLERGPDCAYS
jgi:sugar lactone lactonase YvrE